jgi:predicted phage-related endonuclease
MVIYNCSKEHTTTRKKQEDKIMYDELIKKIKEIKELEELINEAEAEVEALKDELKAELLKRNTEELDTGKYIVRWTSTLSNRFDSTAFKKVMPEVYKAYTKQVSSRRFSISG